MPFADYQNFDDCMRRNKDKQDPKAYCASIMRSVEGDKAREVGGFESPEPGDLPEHGKKILAETYAACREKGGAKEKCAKIAWGAVENAGYKKQRCEAKSFTFYTNGLGYEVVETKAGKEYYITGYVSTSDIDLVNDMVTDEAMNSMLGQINGGGVTVKIDVEHETIDKETGMLRNFIPVGKAVEGRKDDRGLWVKVRLNSAIDRFKDVWESVKGGFLDAFSITFRVKDRTYRMINGIKTRVIHDLELLNVALTGTPVNPAATITEVFAKAVREMDDTEEKREDPHTAKFLRCVESVQKRGGAQNPYAVCTAVLGAEAFKSAEMKQMIAEVKKLMEGDDMDDEDKKPEETSEEKPAEEEKPADATEGENDTEEKPEENADDKPDAETEAKSELVELKSRMDALSAENESLKAEVKALKEMPILKAAGPDAQAAAENQAAENNAPVTPLGIVK